jgi:hypothetical protein
MSANYAVAMSLALQRKKAAEAAFLHACMGMQRGL